MNQLWLITMIFFFTMLSFNISSVFFPLYMQSNGLEKYQIGLAYGMLPLFIIASGFFVGSFLNKLGIKLALSLAVLGYSLSTFILAFSSSFAHFVFSFALLGISASTFWISGRALIYTLKDATKKISYFNTVVPLAGVIGISAGGLLITWLKFQELLLMSSALIFVSFLITLLFSQTLKYKTHKETQKYDLKSLRRIVPFILIFTLIVGGMKLFLPIFMDIKKIPVQEIAFGLSFLVLLEIALQIPVSKIMTRLKEKRSIFFGLIIFSLGLLFLTFSNLMYEILLSLAVFVFGGVLMWYAFYHKVGELSKEKGKSAATWEILQNSGVWVGSVASGYIFQSLGYVELFSIFSILAISSGVAILFIKTNK